MVANIAAQAGAAQVREFTVFSNNNKSLNISGGFIDLMVFQSILDNTVRVSSIIADTGYRNKENSTAIFEQDDLDLTAGERVNLQLEDGYGKILSFKDDTHLRIQQVNDIDESTNKAILTIHLYSKEVIDNELVDTRLNKRYDGRISESVQQILKESLRTPKDVFIDQTINHFSFLGNTEKPFYKLAWLGPKSVPDLPNALGKLAGYFFFETPEGYHFKSIDKLFTQTPKRKLVFTNTPFLPTGYTGKIVSYSISSSVNLDNTLKAGALTKPISKTFNPFNNTYNEEKNFSDTERLVPEFMGGIAPPQIATDLDLWNKATKINSRWRPIGVLPPNPDAIEIEDWPIDDIVRQATARYNNLFNTRLNIVIPGDFSINAGDILTCDFPEISSRASKVISNKHSGNYLVVDIAHKITKENCYTSINLVRESIYKV